MRFWLLVLNEDEYTEQQAYEVDAVEPARALPEGAGDGDEVAFAGPDGVFALGEVDGPTVVYRRRLEAPAETFVATRQIYGSAGVAERPIHGSAGVAEGWTGLDPDAWEDLVRTLPAPERRSDWLVTLSMPIEAVDKAEAVRQFWTYIRSLGPKELPTFVSPYGRELEGTAFLLGAEHEQDPEE